MTCKYKAASSWVERKVEYFAIKHPQEGVHIDAILAALTLAQQPAGDVGEAVVWLKREVMSDIDTVRLFGDGARQEVVEARRHCETLIRAASRPVPQVDIDAYMKRMRLSNRENAEAHIRAMGMSIARPVPERVREILKKGHDSISNVLDNMGADYYGSELHAARYGYKQALALLDGEG